MPRRMEDEIRSLCQQILAGKDDEQQIARLAQLRRALHLHIEHLRARVIDYPFGIERRRPERTSRPADLGG